MRCNRKSFVMGVAVLVSIGGMDRGLIAHRMSNTTKAFLVSVPLRSQPSPLLVHGGEGYPTKQLSTTNISQEKNPQEVLSPLTDEERALDLYTLIVNQPDFVADLNFFRSEQFSGGGGYERIARKGNRYRKESQFWIFVGKSGEPAARLFPDAKSYFELEPPRYESANTSEPFNPKTLALEGGVTFKVLGAVMIEGHRCLKIEAARTERPKKVYLYAARDLSDLVIVAQVMDPPRRLVQRLSNVSLDVPDSLVEIPSDYKPIARDRWLKVETAKVTYKGKPSRDYGVFRSPAGELFVWVNDAPYPWHYLVRRQQATVETAFQGLLVTRSGEYVWRTNETEAFSRTSYRDKTREGNKWKEKMAVIVSPNSVKFRSNDYDRDRAMIEVKW